MIQTPSKTVETYKILVIEDHPVTLEGTLSILRQFYANATIQTADTLKRALQMIHQFVPDLVILDLQIPENVHALTKVDTGIQCLKRVMQQYPHLNLAVQSSFIDALSRIKPDIDNHRGGFTVIAKGRSTKDTFERFDCALKGYTHTRDIHSGQVGLEVKEEWLKTLDLACKEGLQDRAIAKKLNVSESMIRHYWTKIQDVLEIYPENEKELGRNLRVSTCIRARDSGLID